jgi:peptide/nickel transport system permease protein
MALLDIEGLSVSYGQDRSGPLLAVRDVSLGVEAGEIVGLAGESGCGKSTVAWAVTGLLDPPGRVVGGRVTIDGQDVTALSEAAWRAIRWAKVAMVFQASMNVLNPVITLERHFQDTLAAHGVLDREAVRRRAEELFDLVRVPRRFLTAYPHQLSGGMRQRAVIALALALSPRLLILDEPTTALDVVVQRSILQSIGALRRQLNLGILFITHDLSLLVEVADRIVIMYAGMIVEEAGARDLFEGARHPYAQALMRAFPPVGGERRRIAGIGGQPPDLRHMPAGCPFAPRCPVHMGLLCDTVRPTLIAVAAGHRVACHRVEAEEGTHGSVRETGGTP